MTHAKVHHVTFPFPKCWLTLQSPKRESTCVMLVIRESHLGRKHKICAMLACLDFPNFLFKKCILLDRGGKYLEQKFDFVSNTVLFKNCIFLFGPHTGNVERTVFPNEFPISVPHFAQIQFGARLFPSNVRTIYICCCCFRLKPEKARVGSLATYFIMGWVQAGRPFHSSHHRFE